MTHLLVRQSERVMSKCTEKRRTLELLVTDPLIENSSLPYGAFENVMFSKSKSPGLIAVDAASAYSAALFDAAACSLSDSSLFLLPDVRAAVRINPKIAIRMKMNALNAREAAANITMPPRTRIIRRKCNIDLGSDYKSQA